MAPSAEPATNGAGQAQTNGAKKDASSEFSYAEMSTPYRVLNQYHSKPTKLRVACAGAGASGMCLSYKMVCSAPRSPGGQARKVATAEANVQENRTRCWSRGAGS